MTIFGANLDKVKLLQELKNTYLNIDEIRKCISTAMEMLDILSIETCTRITFITHVLQLAHTLVDKNLLEEAVHYLKLVLHQLEVVSLQRNKSKLPTVTIDYDNELLTLRVRCLLSLSYVYKELKYVKNILL